MRKIRHYSDINDKKMQEFIWEKMSEKADAYEAELNADPSLDDVHLTPEMMEDMMRRIAEEDEKDAKSAEMFLSEDDREALELGRKERERRKKRRKSRKVLLRAGILAAVLAVVFGASMSIEANRIRLLNVWNFLQGKEAVIRVENSDGSGEYDARVEAAYADILAKTGIHSVMFMYVPKGLMFINHITDETLENALMFYQHNNTVLTVDMTKKNESSERMQIFDGEVQEEFEIETKYGIASAMKIVTQEGEKDYMAQIAYDNCQYTIYGISSREEFTKMIEHVNFY